MLRIPTFASTVFLFFSGIAVRRVVAESLPVFQPVDTAMVMAPCSWVLSLNTDRDRIPGTGDHIIGKLKYSSMIIFKKFKVEFYIIYSIILSIS